MKSKKTTIYATLMILAMLAVVAIAFLSEMRISKIKSQYASMVLVPNGTVEKYESKIKNLESQNSKIKNSTNQDNKKTQELSKKIETLTKEKSALENENKKLKTEKEEIAVKASATGTESDSLTQLNEVWLMINNGEVKKACKTVNNMNTSGFDDTARYYYRTLVALINERS